MRYPTLLTLLGSALLVSGCEKYALDRQMDELCRKDGGLQVYEFVTLPSSRFDERGELKRLNVGGKDLTDPAARFGPEYHLEIDRKILKTGDPLAGEGRLTRYEYRLFRVADKKLLGVSVSYWRSGGDFITFAHHSSKNCPAATREVSIEAVFVKGE